MMQSNTSIHHSSSSRSAQASLFCTECYYKPGSCGNEPVHHLGTPLPSSPPSTNILDAVHASTPLGSLVQPITRNHEEMEYLNLELINKTLRKAGDPGNSQLQSALMKRPDALPNKDNLSAELHSTQPLEIR